VVMWLFPNYFGISCFLLSLLLQVLPFYDFLDFVQDNLGESVLEETFIHSHLSWSSIIPYLLPPSFTIHDILLVQFYYHYFTLLCTCSKPSEICLRSRLGWKVLQRKMQRTNVDKQRELETQRPVTVVHH